MAKASVVTKTITLELSEKEAQMLADVLWYVGGNPVDSRRKEADAVRSALNNVGVFGSNSPADRSGEIYFGW